MNKTNIEWCDYSANPVKGLCPMHCKDLDGDEYCYAAGPTGIYKRFKWDETIRYDGGAWHTPIDIDKATPGRIFVCSTIELFHPEVTEYMRECCFKMVKLHPQHTFIFLTKRPWELRKYNPWPSNCWVGASAVDYPMLTTAETHLQLVDAKVKFISFEPLLRSVKHRDDWLYLHDAGINWIIIGGRTGRKKSHPPEGWIKEIEDAADKAGIPVFEKPNLRPQGSFRQEWPNQ